MNCDYCLDSFDLDAKSPIKLSCSHTYCKECIEILKNVLIYCPIDNLKVNYNQGEANQEVLNELNFDCPEHNSHCIGVCFDHCCPLCEGCKESHSACKIFKGTQKEIANKLVELVDLASKNKSIYIKNECNPSIFHLDDLVESAETHLKTLDGIYDKFLKNLLSQEEKEKFIKDIKPISKIKGNCTELLPAQDKGLELKIPSVGLEGFEFSKIMTDMNDMIERLNFRDEKVTIELDYIKSGYLAFFRQITTNTKEYDKYFCNFRHTFSDFVIVNGCGFGAPSIDGGSIYISYFEITVNDQKYIEDIGILEYNPGRLTSKINFKNSIIFTRDIDMSFHIEIYGTNNYLFKVLESNRVSVYYLDNIPFSEDFPILYLATTIIL